MGAAASAAANAPAAELFSQLDSNNNGALEMTELDNVIRLLLSVYSDKDDVSDAEKERLARSVIRRFDRDHNNKLTLSEFTSLYESVKALGASMTLARAKFRELDSDNSGFLEAAELIEVSKFVVDSISLSENEGGNNAAENEAMFNKLLKKMDVNSDGKLDLHEFSVLFQDLQEKSSMIGLARNHFADLDVNKSGFIEGAELNTVVRWVQEAMHPSAGAAAALPPAEGSDEIEKEKLMRRVDLNGDGKLNLAGIYYLCIYILNIVIFIFYLILCAE
jgi:Ca2+-binding EF-hand superfamily protein